jgi:hypothetical protein
MDGTRFLQVVSESSFAPKRTSLLADDAGRDDLRIRNVTARKSIPHQDRLEGGNVMRAGNVGRVLIPLRLLFAMVHFISSGFERRETSSLTSPLSVCAS